MTLYTRHEDFAVTKANPARLSRYTIPVVLPQLQTLGLAGTYVTDAGLKELAALKQLQTLRLDNTKVTDAGIAELKKALPDCKILK